MGAGKSEGRPLGVVRCTGGQDRAACSGLTGAGGGFTGTAGRGARVGAAGGTTGGAGGGGEGTAGGTGSGEAVTGGSEGTEGGAGSGGGTGGGSRGTTGGAGGTNDGSGGTTGGAGSGGGTTGGAGATGGASGGSGRTTGGTTGGSANTSAIGGVPAPGASTDAPLPWAGDADGSGRGGSDRAGPPRGSSFASGTPGLSGLPPLNTMLTEAGGGRSSGTGSRGARNRNPSSKAACNPRETTAPPAIRRRFSPSRARGLSAAPQARTPRPGAGPDTGQARFPPAGAR